jgi:hypothetical protein
VVLTSCKAATKHKQGSVFQADKKRLTVVPVELRFKALKSRLGRKEPVTQKGRHGQGKYPGGQKRDDGMNSFINI